MSIGSRSYSSLCLMAVFKHCHRPVPSSKNVASVRVQPETPFMWSDPSWTDPQDLSDELVWLVMVGSWRNLGQGWFP